MNKVILITFVALVTLSSCAVHNGTFSMSVVEKNAIYKDEAVGVSQCINILGVGGVSQDAIIYEAKKDLYRSYPLSNNESYVNFTLDFKKTYYLFFSKSKVTMTADIIKFCDENDSVPFTSKFRNTIYYDGIKKSELFEVGDTIIFSKDQKATILSFPKADYVKLKIGTKAGNFYSKNISIDKIYTDRKDYHGIKPGGSYAYDEKIDNETKTFMGKVIAVGMKSVMLQKGNMDIIIQKYKE